MQISAEFQNVATNLSWFIFSYKDLAELAASGAHLERFLQQVDNHNQKHPKEAVMEFLKLIIWKLTI